MSKPRKKPQNYTEKTSKKTLKKCQYMDYKLQSNSLLYNTKRETEFLKNNTPAYPLQANNESGKSNTKYDYSQ